MRVKQAILNVVGFVSVMYFFFFFWQYVECISNSNLFIV